MLPVASGFTKRVRAPVCKIDLEWMQLPEALRSALSGHMEALRRSGEDEGQPLYTYVTRQSGGTAHKRFLGWQVQLSIPGERKLRRIAKVADSRVGVLAAVAALADPLLREMAAMRAWMHEMAKGGDQAAEAWLATVDLSERPSRRAHGGRPPSSKGCVDEAPPLSGLLAPALASEESEAMSSSARVPLSLPLKKRSKYA